MSVIAVLEPMMVQAFKNGMSFKQVRDRLPGLVARQLKITEAEFHARLEAESGQFDRALNALADRITAHLTPKERHRVAQRG